LGQSSYIGKKIKELRKDQGLTLKKLADMVGVSASYISQVENEKTSPSIATLRLIARALGIRTVDFFADELIDDAAVMPPKLWTKVLLPGWEADVKQLVHIVGDKRMQPFHTTVPPGGGTRENYSHPGEEFGFVLDGELTLTLGDEVHILKKGWAVYYSSLVPHSWRNLGKKECHLIWVVSPPSW
jgi:transcriptional regulator with XRE-family HTH domain